MTMSEPERDRETGFRADHEAMSALLRAARAVLEAAPFEQTARRVFDEACAVTGASSGYVALLSATGEENEVLFLEAGGEACAVDPALPMPIRGLRADAYNRGEVVFDNSFAGSAHAALLPAGHVELRNVMFSPLRFDGRVQGIMGLANKAGDFDQRDAVFAAAFGEFAAMALRNARTLDRLRDTVAELERASTQVRQLHGMLPICSVCHKVRDEGGYWQRVDQYIAEHSRATFSHCLCEECYQRTLALDT
jgi:GAF domain-containing protein